VPDAYLRTSRSCGVAWRRPSHSSAIAYLEAVPHSSYGWHSSEAENGLMVLHGTHEAGYVADAWFTSHQLAPASRTARATIASSQTRRMIALPG